MKKSRPLNLIKPQQDQHMDRTRLIQIKNYLMADVKEPHQINNVFNKMDQQMSINTLNYIKKQLKGMQ